MVLVIIFQQIKNYGKLKHVLFTVYIEIVKQSAVHKQDGHIIPWYARQSGFTATNVPIVLGFSLSPPTVFLYKNNM